MSGCDLCGREGELFRARIEGSLVDACEKCSRFGKVLWKINEVKAEIKNKKIEEENTETVVDDYNNIIRKERERRGLKQDELAKELNEKESVIRKIENKQMMPGLKLAGKIEKFFNVKLIENVSNDRVEIKKAERRGFTLGDAIKQN